ncbi:MAG: SCO family protein [Rhodospirillales bacterium]|nr:SCO family protein [Rhodospirillales bacterium]
MNTQAKPNKPRSGGTKFNGLTVVLAVAGLLVVGVLAARQFWDVNAGNAAETAERSGGALIGGPFTLIDQDGHTVTDQNFRGKWLLVYFGYTYCPDVCPTSLARNADVIDLLGKEGEAVVPILITVDPERDTPEKLKDYIAFFHPRMVGLTGTPEQIKAVTRAYRVYYAKAEQKDSPTYLMDHSSFTYLVDPDGKFVQFFRHETSAQEMAEQIKGLL